MNYTNNNDDRVLLQELQELLAEALQEQKRANLRVNRLQTQVKIVAQRCGHSYHHSAGSASNKNTPPTTNKSIPSHSPTTLSNSRSTTPEQSMEAKSHFLDTTTTSMLPYGWSTAIDPTTQKTYFFNSSTNVVQWTAPTHNSNTVSPFSQNSNSPEECRERDSGEKTKRRRSVYDKLTDHTLYTGIHRTNNTNKEQQSSLYNGSTNTNSNELFHDSSAFLVRDDFDEDGQRYRWKA